MIAHHAIDVGGDWALIASDELLKTAVKTPGGANNKIPISGGTKAQRIEGCRCTHDATVLRLGNQGCFKKDFGFWSLLFGLGTLVFVFGLWGFWGFGASVLGLWILVFALFEISNFRSQISDSKTQGQSQISCLLPRQSCQSRRRRNGVKAQLPSGEL